MRDPHGTTDCLIRGMSLNKAFRIAAVDTTSLSTEICQLQHTDPTATVAMGRLISAAALMISQLKGKQRLAMTIEGNGPLQKLQAEVSATGDVCAKVKNPTPAIPPRENSFDVSTAIGKAGFLRIVKDLGLKKPYSGMVQLRTSEIGDDLAHYFTESEQTPTSVALGVLLDQNANINACGGFMLQVLPNSDSEAVVAVEQRIKSMPSVSNMLAQGCAPTDILHHVFPANELELYPSTPLRFKCHCSKTGVARMLATFDINELKELQKTEKNTLVTCEYCKTRYEFTAPELRQIVEYAQDTNSKTAK